MSLISAVTPRGHGRFMIIGKGRVNADVFIEFLKRLIKNAGREIVLIVDRGSAHRASKAAGGIALVLSASPRAGPQPRRVGVEASQSGHRRPHGGDGSRNISRRRFAARRVIRKMTREKSSPSCKSHRSSMPREYEHTYGRINSRPS
jgi:hypothetical protein